MRKLPGGSHPASGDENSTTTLRIKVSELEAQLATANQQLKATNEECVAALTRAKTERDELTKGKKKYKSLCQLLKKALGEKGIVDIRQIENLNIGDGGETISRFGEAL